jgi:transposase
MKQILSDEVWEAVRPHLPRRTSGRRTKTGGRPSVDDRKVLGGILYVLRTRTAWMMLPSELGFASGITCWRRLREWQAAGVWPQIQDILQQRLADAGAFEWQRAAGSPLPPKAAPKATPFSERGPRAAARWCSL